MHDFQVHEDIRQASTIPSAFYTDDGVLARIRDRLFLRSWQLVADGNDIRLPGQMCPTTVLPGFVDEPVVLTRDQSDVVHALSNVCTHRGNLVTSDLARADCLRCPYHGRKFELNGAFRSMPEFADVADFPSPADDLHRFEVETFGPLVFIRLGPAAAFNDVLGDVRARVGFLPLHEAKLDPERSRDYLVDANWALYCDNYLEGFHIPFVHAGLNDVLDYGAYKTILFEHSNVQIGISSGGEDAFDLPEDSPDHGSEVAGYYFWLFPNTMLNFYPWGMSVNIVKPITVDRTRVSYLTYVWDPARIDRGAGASLDRVEREDEALVESVQRGVRSRFYDRGRYSPSREQGVHHFHRLVCRALA